MKPTAQAIAYASHRLSRYGIVSFKLLGYPDGITPLWEVITSHGIRSTYCCDMEPLVQALTL